MGFSGEKENESVGRSAINVRKTTKRDIARVSEETRIQKSPTLPVTTEKKRSVEWVGSFVFTDMGLAT